MRYCQSHIIYFYKDTTPFSKMKLLGSFVLSIIIFYKPFSNSTPLLPRGFNLRAHAGRDLSLTAQSYTPECFNPRAREGRDLREHPQTISISRFQSTRPRGARRIMTLDKDAVPPQNGFNPRAREGRDIRYLYLETEM